MARPRLSAQQRSLRKVGLPENRKALYVSNPGPQTEFMKSAAEELLYGGSFASGKSWALRAWAVRYCMSFPGAQVFLFRRSYRELEDTHIIAIQQEVPLSVASYSSGAHTLIFNNGSILFLRYCEKNEDVKTYYTTEIDALLIDELQQFTQYQYLNLLSRVRSSKPWWPGPRIRAGATPGDIGHMWVMERWDTLGKRHPLGSVWQGPETEGGLSRQFIPARVFHNKALMDKDPKYAERLKALPEEEYRAKALGDWSVFGGQFFRRWRDEIHVVQPFDIPPDWPRWLCVDYGFNAPYAALWFARVPGTETIYVYREHYGAGVKSSEQIRSAREATIASGEKLRGVILDHGMFGAVNVKGERVRPMADDWRDAFARICPVFRGDPNRVAGWSLLRSLIDWTEAPDGRVLVPPKLYVFSTCSNLARTFPTLIVDKNNVEDLDTDSDDHCLDSLRYGLRHALAGAGRSDNYHHYYQTPVGIRVR